ncbi:phosphoribosyltransferase-like protein [Lipomyces japonicus]|uniref:phosphoribosyltransferase-like protein n=1 Tax=Lipomyces japonicus TaxID=56871 RepID=UPI0034CD6CBE
MRKSKVFVGSSHPELGQLICEKLGVPPAKCTLKKFANGETSVAIGESIRDEDVYIVQSGSNRINDDIMELLIMIAACRGGSANKITAVIPYFPYSKQSKMKKHRGAITARMIANLLTMAGADHVITVDLHAAQMQGFFTKPVDNLHAGPTLARWIKLNVSEWRDAVVVSKNPGGTKRVTQLADALKINFAMINTDRRRRNAWPISRSSPPTPSTASASASASVSSLHSASLSGAPNNGTAGIVVSTGDDVISLSEIRTARVVQGHVVVDSELGDENGADCDEEENEHNTNQNNNNNSNVNGNGSEDADAMYSSIYSVNSAAAHDHALGGTIDATGSDDEDEQVENERMITLVGDVRDRTAIIIDDMIDRPTTFISAAEHCRMNGGAKKVYVIATHGVFGDGCLDEIEKCWCIDHVVVTNSSPIPAEVKARSKKLTVIDFSPILAECIRRNHYGESISVLFDHFS